MVEPISLTRKYKGFAILQKAKVIGNVDIIGIGFGVNYIRFASGCIS